MVILGYTLSYNTENVSKYGQHCPKVTVYKDDYSCEDEQCTQLELEEYIAGIVAGTVGETGNIEYYKASAIIARTYIAQHIDVNCKAPRSGFPKYIEYVDSQYNDLIFSAVESTKKKVMSKSGKILPLDVNLSNDWGMNRTEALDLIDNQEYTYTTLLYKYYGSDIIIENNQIYIEGINGYINPVRGALHCTSPFSKRILNGNEEVHKGLDLGKLEEGEAIFATNDGVVDKVVKDVNESSCEDKSKGYGN